ncbi:MAG: BLUF domain-containing protein [Sphingobium sp.]
MKRLLYISTARYPMRPSELEELLAIARKANAAVGVTGLLVVGGRRFLQVLEGPEDAVTATYERIARDPRHFALVKLHDKPIAERSFEAWAMGYEQGGVAAASATLEEQVDAIVAPLTDANLRAYFAGFAKSHSSA